MTQTTKKQQITGRVVSDKMEKTVVIEVVSKKRHPKYHKTYHVTKRFKAHSPENAYHVGDNVVIEATRPISKDKNFIVIKKV